MEMGLGGFLLQMMLILILQRLRILQSPVGSTGRQHLLQK
jgi:hypothetical protein